MQISDRTRAATLKSSTVDSRASFIRLISICYVRRAAPGAKRISGSAALRNYTEKRWGDNVTRLKGEVLREEIRVSAITTCTVAAFDWYYVRLLIDAIPICRENTRSSHTADRLCRGHAKKQEASVARVIYARRGKVRFRTRDNSPSALI